MRVKKLLSENILPMQESGQLNFIQRPKGDFGASTEMGFDIFYADGHTEKQMLPHILYNGKSSFLCRFIGNCWSHPICPM